MHIPGVVLICWTIVVITIFVVNCVIATCVLFDIACNVRRLPGLTKKVRPACFPAPLVRQSTPTFTDSVSEFPWIPKLGSDNRVVYTEVSDYSGTSNFPHHYDSVTLPRYKVTWV